MTHWIKAYNPVGYQLFEDAAMQSLARSEHFSLDAEMDKYKRAYPDLSNDGIREEIVANSTETFLNDEQFIRDICNGKNKSIGKRIVEWLTDVIDAFKEMISDRSFSRVAEVLQRDVKNYEKTRQLWLDGIDEAAVNMETQQYAGENAVKNQAMLHPEVVTQENFEKNLEEVRKMDPIQIPVEAAGAGADKLSFKEKKADISEIFKDFKDGLYNKDVGKIEFNKKSSNDEAWHLEMTDARLTAIRNLPEIIRRSKPVYYDANHKGNSRDTITLAAKIQIGDGKYYSLETVRIRKESNLHRFELIDSAIEGTNEEKRARSSA